MTKPTVDNKKLLETCDSILGWMQECGTHVPLDAATAIAKALRERLVGEQLDNFRDLDDHVRKASDKIDRAGFYDEATLMVQLWMLKDEWKRKCQECWNAKPSPEPSDGKE